MSYSISIEVGELPPVQSVFASLGSRPVQCVERPTGLDSWPQGILHLHTVGESTRGVELIIEPGEVRARMVSLANVCDWHLAFDVLAALAAHADARVVGEDGTEARVRDLRAVFEDVIVREATAGVVSLLDLSANPEIQEITFEGPVRAVHVGPRLLGELQADDPARAFVRLLERVRRIQYIEREGYEFNASADLGVLLGLPMSIPLSLWNPQAAEAFGPTELLGLSTPGGNLYLPVAVLPALLGERFEWLDDKQFAIAPTPAPELDALYARAATVAIEPWAGLRSKRKWWQVWKRS